MSPFVWVPLAYLAAGLITSTVFTRLEWRREVRKGKTYNVNDEGLFNLTVGTLLWPLFVLGGFACLVLPELFNVWKRIVTPTCVRKELKS